MTYQQGQIYLYHIKQVDVYKIVAKFLIRNFNCSLRNESFIYNIKLREVFQLIWSRRTNQTQATEKSYFPFTTIWLLDLVARRTQSGSKMAVNDKQRREDATVF
jgi:hypothetical protein